MANKKLTKKQWKAFTERDRKRIILHAVPHMTSYYNQFDDTSDECADSVSWEIISRLVKVDGEKIVWINRTHPCGLKAI